MRNWIKHLARLMVLCVLLAGCQQNVPPPVEEPPSPAPAVQPDAPPLERPHPIALDRLTVEVTAAWEEADRILSSLEELSRLLGEALEEKDCTVEEITVTIGTAGGITAQALGDGGVDVAFLPGTDLNELEEGRAVKVLESADQGLAAAITGARADQPFCNVLPEALTETEAGQRFLEICYPDAGFAAAT